jgi:hypothetical protein
MKSRWIDHKGVKILLADYSGFGGVLDQLKPEVEYASELTVREPLNSVLSLVDVSCTSGTPEVMDFLKTAAVKTKPYIRKMAVVGVQGYKKILLRAVVTFSGQTIQACDTIEEAKDWLAA